MREVDEGDATWPDVMKNEITDDLIGILFKADENELRRGYRNHAVSTAVAALS
jgi:hypothetical protein